MKKTIYLIGLMALGFGAILTSCKKDPVTPTDEVDTSIANGELIGNLDHDATLDASVTYKLTGTFAILDGASLTIPAGTRIEAKAGYDMYIAVLQGGKIFINGTADAPVVMTAENEASAESGFWGGLILNGKARISGASGVAVPTATCEMNTEYIYGGDDDADNSGSITYYIQKYAGARSSSDVEHNGITLDAVGSGTTIENVFVYENADDGIECFGGTVNIKNALVVNEDDDCFDNTQGYRGTWTNMYGVWASGYTSTESDPRGIESDGNFDGKTPDDINQTDFKVQNITIDLRLAYDTTSQATMMQDIFKIRRGAKVNITNALVKGSGAAQDIIDCTDSKGDAAAGTSINITNSLDNAFTGSEAKPGVNNASITVGAGNTGCDKSLFSWTGYAL